MGILSAASLSPRAYSWFMCTSTSRSVIFSPSCVPATSMLSASSTNRSAKATSDRQVSRACATTPAPAGFAGGRTPQPYGRATRSYPERVSSHAPEQARVIPLRPRPAAEPAPAQEPREAREPRESRESREAREPLWRDLVGNVLRKERLAQERTLKDVADAARISMPYLSEVERGRKEASSEVLAAAAQALGLGLADVLGLARGELVRRRPVSRSMRRGGSRPPGTASPQAEVRLAA